MIVLQYDAGRLMQPLRLLIFGERYHIRSLNRYIFQQVLAHQSSNVVAPSNAVKEYTYDDTSHGPGIRRLIIDWYTGCLDRTTTGTEDAGLAA